MSRKCEFCGKTPHVGHNVSHANNKSKKIWYPNLQPVRHVGKDGSVRRKESALDASGRALL